MHPAEEQKLKQLQQGKSPEEQYWLAAAECALVQCSAGIPDSDPNKSVLQQVQNDGQQYAAEQATLKNAGAFDGYGRPDKIVDGYDRYQVSNRAVGAVQGVTGAAAAAGAIAAGCASLVACAAGATAAVTSLDYSNAGFKTLVDGNLAPTYGEQALASLGMSPTGAALAYGAVNLGATVGSTISNGVATSTKVAGNDGASVSNNFYRDGTASPDPIGSPSGVLIVADPNKTTTVLGSFALDMDNVINGQLGYPKTTNFGDKTGGFNVLNVPDSMYKNPDQFWSEVNAPFLDQAIQRGDNIVLVTKPTDSVLNRTYPDGTIVRSGFGRELDYLTAHGYTYDTATSSMVKGH